MVLQNFATDAEMSQIIIVASFPVCQGHAECEGRERLLEPTRNTTATPGATAPTAGTTHSTAATVNPTTASKAETEAQRLTGGSRRTISTYT